MLRGIHDHVSIMHGSDTHHAYRPTEDVVSGERLVSFFTFRAPHRGATSYTVLALPLETFDVNYKSLDEYRERVLSVCIDPSSL